MEYQERDSQSDEPWDILSVRIRRCTKCPELVTNRQRVVVGVAPPAARILLIGEAPGPNEDEAGVPFIGRGGGVIDDALNRVGIARSEVAVLNILKCRPPENRHPIELEINNCTPWIEAQMELIQPDVILALGTVATSYFLGPDQSLAEMRGRIHSVGKWRIVATYHPSGVLRYGRDGPPMRALFAAFALAAGALRAQ